MFASLKNKIKEETGSDVAAATVAGGRGISNNNNRMRSRLSSTISVNSMDDAASLASQQGAHGTDHIEVHTLRSQCNDLSTKVTDLTQRLQSLQEEKNRIEKTNATLMESVKLAQTQKDLHSEEQEKIQNIQQVEIEKLKSLLSFREQEAVDRLAAMKQNQQQIENLTGELERLKMLEPMVEDLQDELERFRHSAQLGKNNLTTTLAAVEEENRHLKVRLQIVDQARMDTILSLGSDEKIQALVQERKLLEQHLEEAHLQLSDIKSSWSGQNLALETQVSRLSKQVAEETTEKRKALKARDDYGEKVKHLEFEMEKLKDDLQQRDTKIKLLEEEIDELNLALKESREEGEQEILCVHNKLENLEQEKLELKTRLAAAEERFTEYADNSEQITQTLRQQNSQLQEQLTEILNCLEMEKEEKLTALLRNAEISQSEEILKKELRMERDETNELQEKTEELQLEMKEKNLEISKLKIEVSELQSVIQRQEEKLTHIDDINTELSEKNKTIKNLNQRLTDIKKTVQREMRGSSSSTKSFDNGNSFDSITGNGVCPYSTTTQDGGIVMDEVNFKYLKHVIVKFLTSREVEARHLIRAVATLLKLSKEEEKLLNDTLNWKMSWFGSKPDHGTGQRAFSIPPS
ncbi:golgin subfamily A member 1 [Episyrphus balteatus]|uniref:golgin subfamily A member 1 n=1 Tax=Episyrphus balteatus TaxID=286459 RepID=UPI002485644F|nr:golgin subfamily A member 1 [Episyrphus balteatus]XP_055855062.1 golgin subfamily A member 1 [Episyrphus balteatus]